MALKQLLAIVERMHILYSGILAWIIELPQPPNHLSAETNSMDIDSWLSICFLCRVYIDIAGDGA